eukprot:ctg_2544.g679
MRRRPLGQRSAVLEITQRVQLNHLGASTGQRRDRRADRAVRCRGGVGIEATQLLPGGVGVGGLGGEVTAGSVRCGTGGSAVQCVPDDGVSQRRAMHPDLVGASGERHAGDASGVGAGVVHQRAQQRLRVLSSQAVDVGGAVGGVLGEQFAAGDPVAGSASLERRATREVAGAHRRRPPPTVAAAAPRGCCVGTARQRAPAARLVCAPHTGPAVRGGGRCVAPAPRPVRETHTPETPLGRSVAGGRWHNTPPSTRVVNRETRW